MLSLSRRIFFLLGLRRRNLGGRVRGRILRHIKNKDGIRHHQILLGGHLDAVRNLSDLLRIENALGQSQC